MDKVTEHTQGIKGTITNHVRTWDDTASHLLGNLVNGLHVTSDWIDHADSDGADGSSLVLVWGHEKPDGTRRILAWYEFGQSATHTGIPG